MKLSSLVLCILLESVTAQLGIQFLGELVSDKNKAHVTGMRGYYICSGTVVATTERKVCRFP